MARRKKGPISRTFKREVAIEYVQGGVTMEQLAIKYNPSEYPKCSKLEKMSANSG